MASNVYCDPCCRGKEMLVAAKYCSDCEEFLCADCVLFHEKLKVTASHHVVDTGIKTDKSFDVSKICTKHTDETLDFYCTDHDDICCKSCIANDHRACDKITPLHVAAKGIRSSSAFDDTASEIKYLSEVSNSFVKENEDTKNFLETNKCAVKEEIRKFKAKLLERIENLEREIIKEIDKTYDEQSQNVTEKKKRIDRLNKGMQQLSDQFDFMSKHGSETHLLLLLKQIGKEIFAKSNEVKEMVALQNICSLVFEESDVLTHIESIGNVRLQSTRSDIKFESPKTFQAQIHQQRAFVPSTLEFKSKIPIQFHGRVRITGTAISRDNRLLLCYQGGKELFSLTEDGKLHQCNLQGSPWQVAVVPDKDEALVTLPDLSYVQSVNTVTLNLRRRIYARGSCYGIAVHGETICLGMKKEIYLIDFNGKHLKTLSVGQDIICSLYYRPDGTLLCCDISSDCLYCINQSGGVVFTYQTGYPVGPVDVALDGKGNIYVVCWRSNELRRLSQDGKLIGVMLTHKNNLSKPHTIVFDKSLSKAYISNQQQKDIMFFSCK